MLVDGVWMENVTCPACRYRHPTQLTCAEAKEQALKLRSQRPRVVEEKRLRFKHVGRVENGKVVWAVPEDMVESQNIFIDTGPLLR